MPYINLKTTKILKDDEKSALSREFGKAIECFPGKTERWLMVNIEGGASMWMAGDNSTDCAMLEVSLLGHAGNKAYDDMSAALCSVMENVSGIASSRVYIKYAETEHWGFNGGNF